MSNDPNLLPLPGDAVAGVPSAQSQPAPVALTAPLPITQVAESSFFHLSVPTAAMHRHDGKRLAFVNQYFETAIKEDIDYLRREIALGHPYLREVTGAEVETARNAANPMKAMEERMREKILNELAASLHASSSAESSGAKIARDASLLAGVDLKLRVQERLEALRHGKATAIPVPQTATPLTPVSSADIAGAASSSNSK